MFLSQLRLDLRCGQVRLDLSNAYDMHRTLKRATGDAGDAERLLWRLEPGRHEAPVLIVQSRTEPRWSRLLEQHPGYACVAPPKTMDAFVNRILHLDAPLRFRLRANASVKRDGKRHALRDSRERLKWLERQAAAHGFDLIDALVVSDERLRARKAGSPIILDATLFEGRLLVSDPDRARGALESGIGHGKGFGLGLLSLAPMKG